MAVHNTKIPSVQCSCASAVFGITTKNKENSRKELTVLCGAETKKCEITAVRPISRKVEDYPEPRDYSGVEFPKRQRLALVKKVPLLRPGERIIRAKRNKAITRGPELVNNTFLHKQYGIVAIDGGRMCFENFEFVRSTINQRMKNKNAFAMWRIDDPWLAVSKKSQGKPMGGGKGPVDHYATPVRAGRVILEVGGQITYEEVKHMLVFLAARMPFASRACDYLTLLAVRRLKEEEKQKNINQFTFKYCVQNNMRNCHNWVKPIDKLFYGEYQ